MFQITLFFFLNSVVADIQGGDVWAEMLPAGTGQTVQRFSSHLRSSRRLAKEDFQKTSANFFDFSPNCEQKGNRFCDSSHFLGGGNEFANWRERTQFVYTNMARMDHAAFAKAPYNAVYG